MITDDGDVIRGLGFVCLYSGYLEEAVDCIVETLYSKGIRPKKNLARAAISKKIKFCRDAIAPLLAINEEMHDLDAGLKYAAEKLEHRNDLIHGRIYAQFGGTDVRKSGRIGVPDREVTSNELYALANEIFAAQEPLFRGCRFSINRAFNS